MLGARVRPANRYEQGQNDQLQDHHRAIHRRALADPTTSTTVMTATIREGEDVETIGTPKRWEPARTGRECARRSVVVDNTVRNEDAEASKYLEIVAPADRHGDALPTACR
jgi:hypothetical protein